MTTDGRLVLVKGGPEVAISLCGPALKIHHPRRAVVAMPLTRIGLLAIEGAVALGGDVLAAVAGAGIPVRWLDDQGQLLGDLVPTRGVPDSIADSLDRLLRQHDWREAYAHWRHRECLLTAAQLLGRHGAKPYLRQLPKPGEIERLVLRGRSQALAIVQDLQPHLTADARALLVARGWPLPRVHAPRPGPDPEPVIATITGWHVAGQLAMRPPQAAATALEWYAQHRDSVLRDGRAVLDSFHRWLVDRTWRTFR